MKASLCLEKLKNFPMAVCCLGAAFGLMGRSFWEAGLEGACHALMALGAVIGLVCLAKLIWCPRVCSKEYEDPIAASLFGGFPMLLLLEGEYLSYFVPLAGKIVWMAGLLLYILHIVVFTWGYVVQGINHPTFLPSWFVTYNGIMLCASSGKAMHLYPLCKIIVYIGLIAFVVLMVFLALRLLSDKVDPKYMVLKSALVLPVALCLVSYYDIATSPSPVVMWALTVCFLPMLCVVLLRMPLDWAKKTTPYSCVLPLSLAASARALYVISLFTQQEGYGMYYGVASVMYIILLALAAAVGGYVLFQLLHQMVRSFMKNKEEADEIL